jgi:hypothetical protein
MHCSMLLSPHVYFYTLDHVEPELKEPLEQAQAKDPTNTEFSQGKPRCI